LYPFEHAEALYKEIKKLGTFDDGKNFCDKFRMLITEVGNALGFVRLLRSAQLNFCTKSIEYLPYGYERETNFAESAA
jgi:WASH complex subunit 7